MHVPSWYYSGLASYFGEHWNCDVDAHIKNGILTGKYKRLEDLPPVDATYAGHALWKYLVEWKIITYFALRNFRNGIYVIKKML